LDPFLDMSHRHVFGLLAQNRVETWLFALGEIALTVVPTVLLYQAASGCARAHCTPAP
jgi:hypothetical protein